MDTSIEFFFEQERSNNWRGAAYACFNCVVGLIVVLSSRTPFLFHMSPYFENEY